MRTKRKWISLILFLALAGCKTVDMTPKADTERLKETPETPLPVVEELKPVPEPEVIFIYGHLG